MTGAIGTLGEGLFELGLDADVEAPLRRGYGGDAPNAAVMAARLGSDARVCTRVGADALGRELVDFWRSVGVDTRWVVVDADAPTGIYVNERTAEGKGRFHYHRRGSAGSRLRPDDVGDDFLEGLGFLHTTGATLAISADAAEAAAGATRRARDLGIATTLAVNHRPALGGDPAALLAEARRCDVVFVSIEEAAMLLATDQPDEVVRALGAAREVVVTLGPAGALVSAGGATTHMSAAAVDIVDTAGAGDALAGAYLASRLAGASPEASLERGVVAATLSCRSFGCARSYPDRASVESAVVQ